MSSLLLFLFIHILSLGGNGSSAVVPVDSGSKTITDLRIYMSAITDYQSNNNGKLPFQSETLTVPFVKRYIDPTCGDNAGNKGDTSCTDDTFKNFNGDQYYFTNKGSNSQSGTVVEPANTQEIVVYTNAACSADSTFAEYSSSKTDYALFAQAEDHSIVCVDNQ